jgi:signal transduction histidine kinase
VKKSFLRRFTLSVNRPGRGGLTLLLLLVVLVPSVCLLWFMNKAVQNERLAIRQKLVDAYRGQITNLAESLDEFWQSRKHELGYDYTHDSHVAPAAFFSKQVADLAHAPLGFDSVVCFDSTGMVQYPKVAVAPPPESLAPAWVEAQRLEAGDPAAAAAAFGSLADTTTNEILAARAFQAKGRCLMQAQQTNAALDVLTNALARQKFQAATDDQGRLIAPNAQLMALELLLGADPSRAKLLFKQMQAQLNDYVHCEMPSAQRRFLMHRLEQFFPGETKFPTLAAEDLAARYLESNPAFPPQAGWRPTVLPGVWQFPAAQGQVILLIHIKRLRDLEQAIVYKILGDGINGMVLAPGETADSFLSIPIGPTMPDWKIAFSWKDKGKMDLAADAGIATLLWTGVLAVAGIIALGLLAAGLLRRQMAVAQLKNDLVANVTHELKTPLSSMRLLVDTLLNAPALEEKTAREYLQLIARENLRLSHLIDNFLAFSRIERDKYSFDFQPVPARQIVDSAAAAVRERFSTPGCRFTVAAPPELPPVLADAGALVTALLNLLDNAWKYSGEEKQIVLTAEARDGGVAFAVRDNGIGLPEGETRRIFKRFYQVDPHLSRTGSGCGLGLSIVQFIVTAHHGGVRVESRPGQGSTFTITLPAAGSRDLPETGK